MTKEQFASRLRAAREDTGLTQAQAAEVLGIHRVTYVHYEAGNREPVVTMACAMVEKLGLDPRVIFPEFFEEDDGR